MYIISCEKGCNSPPENNVGRKKNQQNKTHQRQQYNKCSRHFAAVQAFAHFPQEQQMTLLKKYYIYHKLISLNISKEKYSKLKPC